jgi:hypothetical protein
MLEIRFQEGKKQSLKKSILNKKQRKIIPKTKTKNKVRDGIWCLNLSMASSS